MALIDKVDFNVYCTDADIGENRPFPPARFRDRDSRLSSLFRLWQGDLSEYSIKSASSVSVNYFHQYSTKLANLLLMSPIEAGDVNLRDAVYDAIVDMTRYGGAILSWDSDRLQALEPTTWYPMPDGDVFIRPYVTVDAIDSRANAVALTIIGDTGSAEERVYTYSGGQLGKQTGSRKLPDTLLRVVPRLPTIGIWGTAKYVELCGPAVEIARRLSKNSRLLDLYTGPVPVFKSAELDINARFGVTATDDDAEARRKVLEGQVGDLEEETMHLPDTLTNVSFLQPSTEGVLNSLAQVDQLKEALQSLTGLPALTGLQHEYSGEALKRIFLHFYAESAAVQGDLLEALIELLGVQVVWKHIFDELEGSTVSVGDTGGEDESAK